MKTRIANYTFDASQQKITFSDYTTISLDAILLITNVTSNIIIYNFADPTAGGTIVGNILTLDYNTSAMGNSDKLMIYYDDTAVPANNASLLVLQDQLTLLRRITKLLDSSGTVDSGSRQRVVVDAGTVTTAGGAFTGAGTAGYGNSYGASTNPYTITTGLGPVVNAEFPVDQRWRIVNDTRNTFAVGIRSKLT